MSQDIGSIPISGQNIFHFGDQPHKDIYVQNRTNDASYYPDQGMQNVLFIYLFIYCLTLIAAIGVREFLKDLQGALTQISSI